MFPNVISKNKECCRYSVFLLISSGGGCNRIKLNKLMKRLNAAYCSTVGVEFSYVHDPEARFWIKDRMETTEFRLRDILFLTRIFKFVIVECF